MKRLPDVFMSSFIRGSRFFCYLIVVETVIILFEHSFGKLHRGNVFFGVLYM